MSGTRHKTIPDKYWYLLMPVQYADEMQEFLERLGVEFHRTLPADETKVEFDILCNTTRADIVETKAGMIIGKLENVPFIQKLMDERLK